MRAELEHPRRLHLQDRLPIQSCALDDTELGDGPAKPVESGIRDTRIEGRVQLDGRPRQHRVQRVFPQRAEEVAHDGICIERPPHLGWSLREGITQREEPLRKEVRRFSQCLGYDEAHGRNVERTQGRNDPGTKPRKAIVEGQ
jgi:hypothetical protein